MSLSIGLAGLNAASARLNDAAATVARAGAASQRGASHASAADGPDVNPVAAVAPAVPAAETGGPSLPTAMVEQILAGAAIMANINTIRREDEALDSLLRQR